MARNLSPKLSETEKINSTTFVWATPTVSLAKRADPIKNHPKFENNSEGRHKCHYRDAL